MTTTQTIDCRGLQCPEPILRLASAARKLDAGGQLLVRADDDAFPLDVKSWCNSAGAVLEEIAHSDDGYTARIMLRGRDQPRAAKPAPARAPAAGLLAPTPQPSRQTMAFGEGGGGDATQRLDCKGLQCPEPILKLAKAARSGRPIEIECDDPAFELDLKSWCRSTGATLSELEQRGATTRALILPKGAVPAGASREGAMTIELKAPRDDQATRAPLDTVSSPMREARADEPSPNMRTQSVASKPGFELDLTGVADPLDLDRRLGAVGTAAAGMTARVSVASQPLAQAVLRWAGRAGHSIVGMNGTGPVIVDVAVEEHVEEIAPFSSASTALAPVQPESEADCALLVLHNDLEALLAALLVANGAAAQGQRVVLFFTFWGLNLLRGDRPNPNAPKEKVSFIQRMFKWMMPKGPKRQQLGQLNFAGAGPMMLRGLMREKNIMELPKLIEQAEAQGVKFVACTMSMSVMGITKRDLEPRKNLAYGGVAYFVDAAKSAKMSLVF